MHVGDEWVPVEDPTDERIVEFVGLRDAELHRRQSGGGTGQLGIFIAEGDVVVERALRAGYEIRSVLVDASRTSPLPPLPPETLVYGAAPELVRLITGMGMHRGCLASFDRRPVPPPERVLAGSTRVVVLEHVNNPTNLGVIARSAVALGADGLLLDPTCSDPLYRRASRVSMGEIFALPWARLDRFPTGLDVVANAGFQLVALTPDPSATSVDDVTFAADDRVALVLGAEGPGLTDETMARVDRQLRIPIRAGVDSLNVGAAAAIACYVLGRGLAG